METEKALIVDVSGELCTLLDAGRPPERSGTSSLEFLTINLPIAPNFMQTLFSSPNSFQQSTSLALPRYYNEKQDLAQAQTHTCLSRGSSTTQTARNKPTERIPHYDDYIFIKQRQVAAVLWMMVQEHFSKPWTRSLNLAGRGSRLRKGTFQTGLSPCLDAGRETPDRMSLLQHH